MKKSLLRFIFVCSVVSLVIFSFYQMWYHLSPIKTEQYNIHDYYVENANCTWDEPYIVPVVSSINGVTSISMETRYTTYSGYQNQVRRAWNEKNWYRTGKVKETEEVEVIQATQCR